MAPPPVPTLLLSLPLLLVVPVVGRAESVGVCWTRNSVFYRPDVPGLFGVVKDQWSQLYASAATLRGRVKTCLFTDAPSEVVAAAMGLFFEKEAESHHASFDYVIPELDLETFIEEVITRELGGLELWRKIGVNASTAPTKRASAAEARFATRMKRIWNFGRSPFETTLFLDDDTVFCPQFHVDDLRRLAPKPVVRFAEKKLTRGTKYVQHYVDRLARCCAASKAAAPAAAEKKKNLDDQDDHQGDDQDDLKKECWPASCESFLPREADEPHALQLQGGAVLIRGDGRRFARAFLKQYLTRWGADEPTDKRRGMDQPPLETLAAKKCHLKERHSHLVGYGADDDNFTLAALPPNYNVRFFERTTPGIVAGPVSIVHTHYFSHHLKDRRAFFDVVDGICHLVNADLRPRAIHFKDHFENISFTRIRRDLLKIQQQQGATTQGQSQRGDRASALAFVEPLKLGSGGV